MKYQMVKLSNGEDIICKVEANNFEDIKDRHYLSLNI